MMKDDRAEKTNTDFPSGHAKLRLISILQNLIFFNVDKLTEKRHI